MSWQGARVLRVPRGNNDGRDAQKGYGRGALKKHVSDGRSGRDVEELASRIDRGAALTALTVSSLLGLG